MVIIALGGWPPIQVDTNKARFIGAVSKGEIDLIGGRQSKEEMASTLQNLGFDSTKHLDTIRRANALPGFEYAPQDNDENTTDKAHVARNGACFDYLLNMALSSLTTERIESLHHEANKTEKEVNELRSKTAEELWMTDLEKLAAHL